MKLAVYSRVFKIQDLTCIQELFDILSEEKFEILVHNEYYHQIKTTIKFN